MNNTITVAGIGATTISISDAAREQRDDLLSQLRDVTAVSDAFDADTAAAAMRLAAVFTRGIEVGRTEAKAPVLELGRKIDALGKELAAEIELEAKRLSRLLGDYQAEERRKADAAERLARDEARRIADEADRQAREAVQAAPSEAEAVASADRILEAAAVRIVQTKATAALAVAPKTTGTGLRSDVCFEAFDLPALYAVRPELVVLEPNGAAIRAILKANPNLQLPGLRHWTEAKTIVR